jgi:hypothetical protein
LNERRGTGNTNPRAALRQQPAVRLTEAATRWLTEQLETAFRVHGRIPPAELAALDWPAPP